LDVAPRRSRAAANAVTHVAATDSPITPVTATTDARTSPGRAISAHTPAIGPTADPKLISDS
jgi:hypothetical protein